MPRSAISSNGLWTGTPNDFVAIDSSSSQGRSQLDSIASFPGQTNSLQAQLLSLDSANIRCFGNRVVLDGSSETATTVQIPTNPGFYEGTHGAYTVKINVGQSRTFYTVEERLGGQAVAFLGIETNASQNIDSFAVIGTNPNGRQFQSHSLAGSGPISSFSSSDFNITPPTQTSTTSTSRTSTSRSSTSRTSTSRTLTFTPTPPRSSTSRTLTFTPTPPRSSTSRTSTSRTLTSTARSETPPRSSTSRTSTSRTLTSPPRSETPPRTEAPPRSSASRTLSQFSTPRPDPTTTGAAIFSTTQFFSTLTSTLFNNTRGIDGDHNGTDTGDRDNGNAGVIYQVVGAVIATMIVFAAASYYIYKRREERRQLQGPGADPRIVEGFEITNPAYRGGNQVYIEREEADQARHEIPLYGQVGDDIEAARRRGDTLRNPPRDPRGATEDTTAEASYAQPNPHQQEIYNLLEAAKRIADENGYKDVTVYDPATGEYYTATDSDAQYEHPDRDQAQIYDHARENPVYAEVDEERIYNQHIYSQFRAIRPVASVAHAGLYDGLEDGRMMDSSGRVVLMQDTAGDIYTLPADAINHDITDRTYDSAIATHSILDSEYDQGGLTPVSQPNYAQVATSGGTVPPRPTGSARVEYAEVRNDGMGSTGQTGGGEVVTYASAGDGHDGTSTDDDVTMHRNQDYQGFPLYAMPGNQRGAGGLFSVPMDGEEEQQVTVTRRGQQAHIPQVPPRASRRRGGAGTGATEDAQQYVNPRQFRAEEDAGPQIPPRSPMRRAGDDRQLRRRLSQGGSEKGGGGRDGSHA